MGTRWSVAYVAPRPGSDDGAEAGIAALLAGIVGEMSHWEPESAISRFNRAPAGSWHALPPGLFGVLSAGLRVGQESGGAFDPAVGALAARWGFGPVPPPDALPSDAEIAALRLCPGLVLDPPAQRAFQPGGMALDLSGIAKGHAVDRIAAFLRARGIADFLAEIGGEYVGAGVMPDGQPWWVDIEMPPGAALAPVRIALCGLAAATSGDYRRCFEVGGRRFGHGIDPRSGRPADNGAASVTVLHQSCMMADAYATAVAVLGPDEGLAFAERHALACFIAVRTADGFEERVSRAFAAMLG